MNLFLSVASRLPRCRSLSFPGDRKQDSRQANSEIVQQRASKHARKQDTQQRHGDTDGPKDAGTLVEPFCFVKLEPKETTGHSSASTVRRSQVLSRRLREPRNPAASLPSPPSTTLKPKTYLKQCVLNGLTNKTHVLSCPVPKFFCYAQGGAEMLTGSFSATHTGAPNGDGKFFCYAQMCPKW